MISDLQKINCIFLDSFINVEKLKVKSIKVTDFYCNTSILFALSIYYSLHGY